MLKTSKDKNKPAKGKKYIQKTKIVKICPSLHGNMGEKW